MIDFFILGGLLAMGLCLVIRWQWRKDIQEYDHEYDNYGD